MVDSIQGFGTMGIDTSFRPRFQSLTDDQKSQVDSILSQYDKDNLTSEDAKSIFNAFKEAGIGGPGLRETIEAAGFDAEELRSMAGFEGKPPQGGGRPPAPQQSSQNVNLSALQSLQTILSQYDLSSLSSDQETDLMGQLQEAGLMKSGNLIDLSA